MIETVLRCDKCGDAVGYMSSRNPPVKKGPTLCGNCGRALGMRSALDGPGVYSLQLKDGRMVLERIDEGSWWQQIVNYDLLDLPLIGPLLEKWLWSF